MASDHPWFVIAGGGTGGHLYPGLAAMQAVRSWRPEIDVTVFGTPRSIDRKLVEPRGFELVAQDVRPFTKRPWRWPAFLAAWTRSKRRARQRFRDRRPAAVLGLGGYAAAPAVVAAAGLGIPTAIFNPDATPGRANRWLASRVDRVFVQWESTGDLFPRARQVSCTGCPIRPEFDRVDRDAARQSLDLDPDKKVLLVTGASQGARSINMAMMELFDLWESWPDWQIVHLTGDNDLAECRDRYHKAGIDARTIAFTEKMPQCMAAADLIICRAGASTLAEISAMRLAAVLMPYPFDRQRHQLANARVLVDERAAELVEDTADPARNAAALREVLPSLMRSDQHRQRLSRAVASIGHLEAAQAMAQHLLDLAGMPV